MEIDFILHEMTALKYFIPIIIESNKLKIQSNFFCNWEVCKHKYCSIKRNKKNLYEISSFYNINIYDITNLFNRKNPVLTLEDVGMNEISYKNNLQKFYSINYCGDFIHNYQSYKNTFENIFMLSKYFANYYDCNDEKNLFFGSPKFDINLDNKSILNKYKLRENNKFALIFYPKKRDIKKINVRTVYSLLRDLGYKVIVKTRGKDPVYSWLNRGDFYFLDTSWYPHTSQELIKISDIVINFGSTAIEECVMMNKPIVEFNVKPFENLFKPLYDYKFSYNFDPNFNKNEFKNAVNYLIKSDLKDEFKNAQNNNLFNTEINSSKEILEFLIKIYS